MKLKEIIDENFQDYKKPSMMLATCICDWKCLKECDLDISICQNSELVHQKTIEVSNKKIITKYLKNPISQAVVIGGLEPFLQYEELLLFVQEFRSKCTDEIIIYTGYYPSEIYTQMIKLQDYNDIIIKFGRFRLNSDKRYDEVLGIWLASDNQYAVKIS